MLTAAHDPAPKPWCLPSTSNTLTRTFSGTGYPIHSGSPPPTGFGSEARDIAPVEPPHHIFPLFTKSNRYSSRSTVLNSRLRARQTSINLSVYSKYFAIFLGLGVVK